jgi:elongation of very long chain fatty acids protein 7
MFWGFGVYGWFGKYDFKCQPLDRSSTNPDAVGMMRISWLYFFSKLIEFLDTIFFVLRKKDNQITALHLIHHATMPFNCWLGVYFAPGGHATFGGWLNSFVHVVMYSYYGLSAIGPHMSKYLFWKRYITTLQLTQFVVIMVHSVQLFFRECDYPKFFIGYILFLSFIFLFMFSDFYVKAYVKKNEVEKQQQLTNGKSGVNHAVKISDKLL